MNRKKIESLILKAFISTVVVFSAAVAVPNFVVNKNCNFPLITTAKVYAAANISQDNMKTISAGSSSFAVKTDGTTGADINEDPIVNVTAISLDKSTYAMTIGQAYTLTASITPTNASNKNIKWTSSDSSVASVDQGGKVTAIKEGTATITVSTQDGTNLSASCTILVQDGQTITLSLFFVDDTSETYEISLDEFNNFMTWYCNEVDVKGKQQPVYILSVPATKYSKAKKVYIMFRRITSVEVE